MWREYQATEKLLKQLLLGTVGDMYTIVDIRYVPLISGPPTNQLTIQVKMTLQQSAPSSHEYSELQALHLGNHKNVWS